MLSVFLSCHAVVVSVSIHPIPEKSSVNVAKSSRGRDGGGVLFVFATIFGTNISIFSVGSAVLIINISGTENVIISI